MKSAPAVIVILYHHPPTMKSITRSTDTTETKPRHNWAMYYHNNGHWLLAFISHSEMADTVEHVTMVPYVVRHAALGPTILPMYKSYASPGIVGSIVVWRVERSRVVTFSSVKIPAALAQAQTNKHFTATIEPLNYTASEYPPFFAESVARQLAVNLWNDPAPGHCPPTPRTPRNQVLVPATPPGAPAPKRQRPNPPSLSQTVSVPDTPPPPAVRQLKPESPTSNDVSQSPCY